MKKTLSIVFLVFLAWAAAVAQKNGPRVYVSVDMEGIWGVVHGDQTSSTTADFGPARRWMAEDVNAVLKGLWEAGAAAILDHRIGGRSVGFSANDYLEGFRLLRGLIALGGIN